MKTWDILDRETGDLLAWDVLSENPLINTESDIWVSGPLWKHEVAYCRETGEVVYR